MKFNKKIENLSDADLPRYKNFLLDKVLGDQPENRRRELFRSEILDRVDKVNEEIRKRDESKRSYTRGNSSKPKD